MVTKENGIKLCNMLSNGSIPFTRNQIEILYREDIKPFGKIKGLRQYIVARRNQIVKRVHPIGVNVDEKIMLMRRNHLVRRKFSW